VRDLNRRFVTILASTQEHQSGQILDEDESNPLGHSVSSRRFKRPVERNDRVDDAAHV